MVDLMSTLSGLLPAVKLFAIIFVGGAIVAFLAYYIFIVQRRKKWMLSIYEVTSDGRLHLIGKDTLVEKRLEHGKIIMYWLTKLRQETMPPPADAVDRVGNANFADYLRIRHSVIPIVKKPTADTTAQIAKLVGNNHDGIAYKALNAIKTNPAYQTKPIFGDAHAVESRFIYVPINRVPHVDIAYNQLSYDVDMMRINMIDNLDKQFAGQKSFFEKYGAIMIMGFLIVAIIVVAYLAFDFMNGVIRQNLDKTYAVIKAIQGMNVGGGAKPPQ
jgi:hypothetical protein